MAQQQNEDVVRFLLPLRSIDPKDPANTYNIRAMAPLLGNWDKSVPSWYDWERHRWRGYWLGTEYVKADDNLRFGHDLIVIPESAVITGVEAEPEDEPESVITRWADIQGLDGATRELFLAEERKAS